MSEVTIENPNRKRKFGWNYNLYTNFLDGSIDKPSSPLYEGTLNQVYRAINEDRNYAAHRNVNQTSAWFFQKCRITHTWAFGLIKEAPDLPYINPHSDDKKRWAVEDEWWADNQEHHFKNDQYGYGWFRGFVNEPDRWENDQLRVRVV